MLVNPLTKDVRRTTDRASIPDMATEGVPTVRALTASDLDWVLDLIEPRREQLRQHAPHFWNPAPDARELHRRFLGRQIAVPEMVTLRTEHGFVFAGPRDDGFLIDDMMVAPEELWPTEGAELVRAAVGRRAVRIVVPVHERARAGLAESLGLTVTESWWTRELEPVPDGGSDAQDIQDISVAGTTGRLLPAPPVYAPGGPVLILGQVSTGEALAAAERQAEAAGAPVAVVPHKAGDQARAALLQEAGYRRTTDYYDGVPVAS